MTMITALLLLTNAVRPARVQQQPGRPWRPTLTRA